MTGSGNSKSCVANTIEHCKTPVYATGNTPIQCSRCEPGYVRLANSQTCERINVDHCEVGVVGQVNQCTSCSTGFFLLNTDLSQYQGPSLTSVTRHYCLPMDPTLNCASGTMTVGANNYAEFECNSCSLKERLPTAPAVGKTDVCWKFNEVSDCSKYVVGELLSGTNFSCETCDVAQRRTRLGYSCTDRVNKPANCKTYDWTNDVCTVCENNSYVDDAGKKCTLYPNGVVGCTAYAMVNSARTCTACDTSKYYLVGTTCTEATTVDSHCLTVKGDKECLVCDPGYFLNQTAVGDVLNSCDSSTITNCSVLESVTSCATCNAGFKRTTSNGVSTCSSLNDSRCLVWASEKCQVCSQNFYPDANDANNKCTVVSPVISGCK